MNFRALVAEFVGVFALCFVGIGVIAATGGNELLTIALGHGLAIGLMVAAVGHISGGHFNPAVTFGMLITGRIGIGGAIGYIIAQLLGGLAAAALISGIYGTEAVSRGTPVPGDGYTAVQALMMEVVMAFFLVWVIFGTAIDRGYSFAGLAIGLTITMDILAGGPVTGAAINPARALGPSIIGGVWNAHWIYWVGPFVGAGLAATLYSLLYSETERR